MTPLIVQSTLLCCLIFRSAAANNDQAPGTRLELYSSNGGYPNQHWNWDASSGRITTAMNGFCIAAC